MTSVSVDLQSASSAQLVAALDAIAHELAVRSVDDAPETAVECMRLAEALAASGDLVEAVLAGLIRRVDRSGELGRWGLPSAQAWLRSRMGMREGRAKERVMLARQLPRLRRTATKLASGRLSYGYAATICDAVARLDDEDAVAGEEILLGLARHASAGKVAVAGRRIVELIRQRDGADAPCEDVKRGYERSWIVSTKSLDGGRYLKGYLHAEDAAVWDGVLAPLARPAGGEDRRDVAERTAAALTGVLSQGHRGTKMTVLVELETLMGGRSAARLLDGTPIAAEQARRMALSAGVSALILGPKGRPLYYGYRQRFATVHQREVLQALYPTCCVEGCEIPGTLCEVDHVNGFALGQSPTDINMLTLACGWHNRFKSAHPDQVRIALGEDGRHTYGILPPDSSTAVTRSASSRFNRYPERPVQADGAPRCSLATHDQGPSVQPVIDSVADAARLRTASKADACVSPGVAAVSGGVPRPAIPCRLTGSSGSGQPSGPGGGGRRSPLKSGPRRPNAP